LNIFENYVNEQSVFKDLLAEKKEMKSESVNTSSTGSTISTFSKEGAPVKLRIGTAKKK
jgi:hypothetical protein